MNELSAKQIKFLKREIILQYDYWCPENRESGLLVDKAFKQFIVSKPIIANAHKDIEDETLYCNISYQVWQVGSEIERVTVTLHPGEFVTFFSTCDDGFVEIFKSLQQMPER